LPRVLGTPEHGRWLIEAIEPGARISRAYRERTLVLETLVETSTGAATVLEFMPPRGRNSDIVRLVRGERGCVRMRSELVLRFDYGRTIPWVTRLPDGAFCAIAGPDLVTLHTSVPLHGEGLTTIGEFAVPAGTTVSFVLTHGSSHLPPPAAIDPRESLEHTEAFWRDWAAQSQSEGEWSDVVIRSLITLTALTYAPTGGLVAAPTTSLPEQIGGSRNWDYRFCWLRDATLTLLALMNAGYYGEARAWRDWLLRAAAGAPAQLQIMYGLAGERRLIEYEVPSLPGYESSPPVRIGNAAHGQLQLDVFGEVMDALHQARRGGLQSRDEDWGVPARDAAASSADRRGAERRAVSAAGLRGLRSGTLGGCVDAGTRGGADLPCRAGLFSRRACHGDADPRILSTRVGARLDMERAGRRDFNRAGTGPPAVSGPGHPSGEYVRRRGLLGVGAGTHREARAGPLRCRWLRPKTLSPCALQIHQTVNTGSGYVRAIQTAVNIAPTRGLFAASADQSLP
jgi:hypothetical protein